MLNAIVDLSHLNTVTDLAAAKNQGGILGVIHKATQGTSYRDPSYSSRRAQALAAGMLWGAYHFGTGGSGADQATFFLSVVNPQPGEVIALDFETNTTPGEATMTLQEAEEFVATIHGRTGRWPGIYLNPSFLAGLVHGKDTLLANCWLWIADWNAATPIVPPTWSTWTIWQYADNSQGPNAIPGIANCDRDRFNGDTAALHAFWQSA
ncbi:MAG: hypothetical protein OHK0022_48330 [Roseiflexaceae bacterium]